MAYLLETGAGLANSNAYGSVAEADAYFLDRGNDAWGPLVTADKETYLILATDYIEQRYGARFIGSKAVTVANGYDHDQALVYPRLDTPNTAWDYKKETAIGVIPRNLKYACFEYANRVRIAPLAPDPVIDASGVTMVTIAQKAGPVEQQFATASGRSNAATVNLLRPYPGADMWLRDLLTPAGGRTFR